MAQQHYEYKLGKFSNYNQFHIKYHFPQKNTFDNVHQYIPDDIPKHLVPTNLDSIDLTFGVCVYIIYEIGEAFNLSYNAANIWIFVVIMPSLIVVLFLYSMSLRRKLRRLRLLSSPVISN